MTDINEQLAEAELAAGELEEYRNSAAFRVLQREEQVLLNRQSVVMHGLVEILNERIAFHKRTRS